MRRGFALLAVLLAFAFVASAEEAEILAEYYVSTGSLPPKYTWETDVTIYADGTLTLRRCTGYETEGPACTDRKAKVDTASLEAISVAAHDSGLAESPAKDPEDILVGAGVRGGAVYLDGRKIPLPSQSHRDDANRVAAVLAAIEAAIPARLDRFFTE